MPDRNPADNNNNNLHATTPPSLDSYTSEYQHCLELAASACDMTVEDFSARIQTAAQSDKYDHCLTWRDWDSYPGLEEEVWAHIKACPHCMMIAGRIAITRSG